MPSWLRVCGLAPPRTEKCVGSPIRMVRGIAIIFRGQAARRYLLRPAARLGGARYPARRRYLFPVQLGQHFYLRLPIEQIGDARAHLLHMVGLSMRREGRVIGIGLVPYEHRWIVLGLVQDVGETS